jgi:hypothetical protein
MWLVPEGRNVYRNLTARYKEAPEERNIHRLGVSFRSYGAKGFFCRQVYKHSAALRPGATALHNLSTQSPHNLAYFFTLQAELAGSPILRVAHTSGNFQPAAGEFSRFKWLVK